MKTTDPNAPAMSGTGLGLTKREIFAMAAMQGLLAQLNESDSWPINDKCGNPYLAIGLSAVTHADALIAALNAEPEERKD